MMNKRKLGALIATIALIAAIAIGGTLAYFTDNDANTNVVKMGHVDITLTETSDGGKGTPITTPNGLSFTNVLPGDTLSKVPTITVANDSAACYVRVKLACTAEGSKITSDDLAKLNTSLISNITADGAWDYNANDGYFYCTTSKVAGDEVNLFKTVTIPVEWANNVADQTFNIAIKAEAIQASYVTYNATNVYWADANGVALNTTDLIQQYSK